MGIRGDQRGDGIAISFYFLSDDPQLYLTKPSTPHPLDTLLSLSLFPSRGHLLHELCVPAAVHAASGEGKSAGLQRARGEGKKGLGVLPVASEKGLFTVAVIVMKLETF